MNYFNRGGGFLSSIPQVVKIVLIINVAIFVLDPLITPYLKGLLVPDHPGISRGLNYLLAMYTPNTGGFKPYQLVTHMFLHGSWGHLFFNMFAVFMFGKVLEQVLGGKKFFILYFVSGLGAALLQFAIYYFQGAEAAMIGASGAVFGILVAFAMMFPNVELMLLFLPIPIKAKYLVPIYAIIELFFGVASFSGDNIAHFAHLGGGLFGFILIKFWKRNQFNIM